MTRLLEQAFDEASLLDDGEQDAVAKWLLDELASERRWEAEFEGSADALAKLADEAYANIEPGCASPRVGGRDQPLARKRAFMHLARSDPAGFRR